MLKSELKPEDGHCRWRVKLVERIRCCVVDIVARAQGGRR